jgi:hypothetical protein
MLHWLLAMKNIDGESEMKKGHRQISQVARQQFPSIDYPAAAEVIQSIKLLKLIQIKSFTICS